MVRLDPERATRTSDAIRSAGWDAIVCAHPKNVLLLTGYWPIIGNSIAVADRDGRIVLIVPKDEEEYTKDNNADEILPFLTCHSAVDAVRDSLTRALKPFERVGARIAIERGPISQEASYVGMTLFGFGISQLIRELLPQCTLGSVEDVLYHERAILTKYEQGKLRIAAKIAEGAYVNGIANIRAGMTELMVAQQVEPPLSTIAGNYEHVKRARGMVSCMSGTRAGSAFGAFAMSTHRTLHAGELILLHANSHADGFWTDLTRTYSIGEVSDRMHRMYEAILEASHAGIATVKAGIRAENVDKAVREVLEARGFGAAFKHDAGHGIGFSAIDHEAKPRLRNGSQDILDPGMAMNIEPGIYFEGFGGIRQCDMVLVTEIGAEVLTPFHNTLPELHLNAS